MEPAAAHNAEIVGMGGVRPVHIASLEKDISRGCQCIFLRMTTVEEVVVIVLLG
jgi:hypothetical protein